MKSNYTEDKKYLAVITNNGLWIKDIYNENILMINASSFNNNELQNAYISEFDKILRSKEILKAKKLILKTKSGK